MSRIKKISVFGTRNPYGLVRKQSHYHLARLISFYEDTMSLTLQLDRVPSTLVPAACPPASELRNPPGNWLGSGPVSTHELQAYTADGGLIRDGYLARNVCQEPWLLHSHGALVHPQCRMLSNELLPIFAGSHIEAVNHEITIPDSLYWNEDPDYSAQSPPKPWRDKIIKAVWRGSNTGGKHNSSNWQQFHRHRFVTATNATILQQAYTDDRQVQSVRIIAQRLNVNHLAVAE
jgi:hypothetical protein